MEAHPRTVAILCIAATIIVVTYAGLSFANAGRHAIPNAYFVDEDSLATVTRSTLEVPPLHSGSATLVYGVYMACGDCGGKKLAYLQKFTDEGKKSLEDHIRQFGEMPSPMEFGKISGSPMIRLPDKGAPWLSLSDPEAKAILENMHCPENVSRIPCFPN